MVNFDQIEVGGLRILLSVRRSVGYVLSIMSVEQSGGIHY